ncbi:peptide chain release factor N(5)-glutamine methyltransferase [uncultured Alistipes sp.]|uniref:peptide chain release factor N(5)-glutamine methyltransferase n=1 Tax=uncultured Alistipes sp. TaxID=538949 RepID=UPI002594981C|nr:peptide chain release factor N(5)-glutamine methyltransferase [uncultured Alistipes sp.]
MSAPETPAPYAPQPQDGSGYMDAPQPLDAAEGHGNPPSQAAPEGTTRRGLLDKLTARLTGLYDAREARSIALIALAELAGLPLSALLTDPGAPMAADGFEAMAAQLAAGRPVQYVVGHTEFYGHRFTVREGVLIPRPETEELVSWVVHDERRARALLDVGTGSGCIAASLALALPGAEVCAADLSDAALVIAAENCRTLGARVTLRKADALGGLDEAFPGPFDAIVSNPPYVPQSDLAAMHANVRGYEPREALFVPDDDALRFYRAIARAGRRMLRPGGKLYFEIYERSAGQMRLLLGEEGYTDTEVREDLNGKPRMVCSRMK